jgi:hypothetical protein
MQLRSCLQGTTLLKANDNPPIIIAFSLKGRSHQAEQHLCADKVGISIAFPAELEHLLPSASGSGISRFPLCFSFIVYRGLDIRLARYLWKIGQIFMENDNDSSQSLTVYLTGRRTIGGNKGRTETNKKQPPKPGKMSREAGLDEPVFFVLS